MWRQLITDALVATTLGTEDAANKPMLHVDQVPPMSAALAPAVESLDSHTAESTECQSWAFVVIVFFRVLAALALGEDLDFTSSQFEFSSTDIES